MKKLTAIAALVGSALLTGCSTTPDAVTIAKNEVKAQEIRNEIAEKKQEQAQDLVEKRLSSVPEWVLEPPKSDTEGVFGVGIGESKRLNIAIKKSNMNGQFELAKKFKQEISGSEQNYTQETVAETTEQYTQLIDTIVDAVPVVGYKTIQREAVAIDGSITVYTLLKLPYDEFNAILEKKSAEYNKKEIKEAFGELRARLEERKQFNTVSSLN